MVSTLLPMVVILAVLLAAVLLAAGIRRHGGIRPSATQDISIRGVRRLAAQQSLMIVEAEGERFLVAAGRGGITLISALGETGRARRYTDPVVAGAAPQGARHSP